MKKVTPNALQKGINLWRLLNASVASRLPNFIVSYAGTLKIKANTIKIWTLKCGAVVGGGTLLAIFTCTCLC